MNPSPPPPDERQPSAPETWLDAYGDYLYRYALLQVRNEALAEDLVQETLLAALKCHEGFNGRASERTWLTGILKHKILDQLRRQYREVPLGDEAGADCAEEDFGTDDFFTARGQWAAKPLSWNDPAKATENALFWEVLNLCIERLAPKQRQLFVLRELHGSSNEEICKDMGISMTNAGVMLYRARMSLRQCLELNWFGQTREKETR
ncbi:sigma-70 family RNA polymerase sigma factor [Methylococcus sp. ANG]|uniref:sigma-70 family RNA polymerase sigma factor n=1 Tax=Methylococcus sp. ANG TaxID=3231903 RepID=UPI00345920F8